MKYIVILLSIVLVFFYVYAPPFQSLPFGTDKPILILSLLYITHRKQWHNLYVFFRKEYLLFYVVLFFSGLVAVVHRQTFSTFFYDLLLMIEGFACSWAIYSFLNEHKLKLDKILIITSVVASIISCFLLLNPEITFYVKNSLLKYPEQVLDTFLFRGYGLADSLLYAYPVVQGFCAAFILMKVGGNNVVLNTSLLFLFVSIVCNARSGFVPIVIALVLLLIYKRTILLGYSIAIVVFLLVFAGSLNIFIAKNEMLDESLEWAGTSIDIVDDFMHGRKSENVEVLLGDMVVWPSTLEEWILGQGKNLFFDKQSNTDIGYFIRLNYGGVLYCFPWLCFCFFMYRRLYKTNRGMALLMFLSLLYLNYKGDFFAVNPATRLFFLVYVSSLVDQALFRNVLVTPNSRIEQKCK